MSKKYARVDDRDSLILKAKLKLGSEEQSVRVRNLSRGGAMIEGAANVSRNDSASIDLRNIGWVDGHVAWVAEDRCGFAFDGQIDPRRARFSVPSKVTPAPTPKVFRYI